MLRLSEQIAVEEQNGKLVVAKCNQDGTEITDKIALDEHELRQLIQFSHNALGVPQDDPFPRE